MDSGKKKPSKGKKSPPKKSTEAAGPSGRQTKLPSTNKGAQGGRAGKVELDSRGIKKDSGGKKPSEGKKSPAKKSTEAQSPSGKHEKLLDTDMGNKNVGAIPGVGPVGRKELKKHGIDRAYDAYGMYLQKKKDPEATKAALLKKGVQGDVYADRVVGAFKDMDISGKKPKASKTSQT